MATKRFRVPTDKKPKIMRVPMHTESMVLIHELRDNRRKIKELRIRNREIERLLAGQEVVRGDYYDLPIKLYALRLRHGCWYIGMSRNPEKRLDRHKNHKGATWTKKHPPIEIAEVRETGLTNDAEAAYLEDEMTVEYALRYGTDCVRGGSYCQEEPYWPEHLFEPDLSWIVQSQ